MYIYVYIYIYIYKYIYTYTAPPHVPCCQRRQTGQEVVRAQRQRMRGGEMDMYMDVHTYIYMDICMYVCLYIYIYLYVWICIWMWLPRCIRGSEHDSFWHHQADVIVEYNERRCEGEGRTEVEHGLKAEELTDTINTEHPFNILPHKPRPRLGCYPVPF